MAKKRKAEAAAGDPSKRLKTSTQPNPAGAKRAQPKPDTKQPSEGVSKPDKQFNNWLAQMRKHHRKQVNKAKNGQQVELKWNERRLEVIKKLRAEGMLKADEEGDFSWPVDIPPSKYDFSTKTTASYSDTEEETGNETTPVAKTGKGEQVAPSAALGDKLSEPQEQATRVVHQETGTKIATAHQNHILWSGSVVMRLADVTGGENARPELVLKLNIQVCQEPAQAT